MQNLDNFHNKKKVFLRLTLVRLGRLYDFGSVF